MAEHRILFVCLGNICRSPMAEGMFRHLSAVAGEAATFHVDSAGTGAWHVGEAPDQRAQETLRRRGIDISGQRARRVSADDFARFDLLLAMDEGNLAGLMALAPPEHAHKVRLFLDFAPGLGASEVPDPYYGGGDGFDTVLDMVEAASRGLIADLTGKR